ncbi:CotH kinase family protein [Crocinitomicaceae bacterium]|nr:CotH kinase family protein [Crocinitomicaceae bacterium]
MFKDYFSAENVMDWHLLLLITQNGDGIKKNNYIYRKSSGQPFLYIPWDFDHSFGREGDGEPMNDKLCDLTQHILFKRLIEINPNNYLQKLNARFLSLKKQDILTVKNIFELIDDNVKKLRPEIEANESRWPLNEVSYFKKSSFEMEVNRMKEWIENHLPKVEQHLNVLQKR